MEISELQQNIHDPSSQDDFEIIQSEAESLIEDGEIIERIDLANFISKILVERGVEISQKKPDYYEQYQKFWVLLTFKSFAGFKPQDQESLMQKRVLFAIQNGLQPEEITHQFFDIYRSQSFISEIFRTYAKDLEQNSETLGGTPIEVEGKKYLPQIKYWILDYSKFPSKVAKRGAVELLNYINQSANTRQLTQQQRNQLLNVLKLYDYFLNAEIPINYQNRSSLEDYTDELYEAISTTATPSAAAPVAPSQAPTSAPVPQPTPVQPQQTPNIDIGSKLEELKNRALK